MRSAPHLLRVLVTATASLLAASAPASAAPAQTRSIGGVVATADQAPWQVAVRNGGHLCGGAILDATRVLTAAHCAREVPGGAPAPAGAYAVQAGFSDIATWAPGMPAPAGTQVVGVAAATIHPYYDATVKRDDVMLLTLAAPLDLSGPAVRPIALTRAGAAMAPGTPLEASGFGLSEGGAARPDGLLRRIGVTVLLDDTCWANLPGNSAVVLCARAAPETGPCMGDSGGPLVTAGAAPVLVGLTSYAGTPRCGTGQDLYVDLAAGEIRAFVDGRPSIPRAPHVRGGPRLYAPLSPRRGSRVTCRPGHWTGSPRLTFRFQDGRGRALQTGRRRAYRPSAAARGRTITCVVQATNAGGTTTARTGTTSAVR